MNSPTVEVLKPSVAGRFYPSDPEELRREVTHYLEQSPVEPSAKPVLAILVPHAGYVFSGPIAGCSFRHVQNQSPDVVLFLALSHQGTPGGCVYTGRFFETPLGMVPVDAELTEALVQSGAPFHTTLEPYMREHSVEVNLPFVQVAFPDAKVASVLITYPDPVLCRDIGRKIAEAVLRFPQKKTLIVVSSDLSHYPDYESANRVDIEILKSLESLDPAVIQQDLHRLEASPVRNLRCVMCGSAAMITAVEAARALGAREARILHYQNSGDSPAGGHDRVVGYGAFAIYRPEADAVPAPISENETVDAVGLSPDDKRTLLALARAGIVTVLRQTGAFPTLPINDRLRRESGVFVTLKKQGLLRGCLGRFDSDGTPLFELVTVIAAESATHDMRFSPVTLDELPELDIQISVLSPVVPVQDISEIVVGRDGLKIRGRNAFGVTRTGTLLPQVAVERNWDVVQFLCATCEKTGIDSEAWRDSQTEIFKYSAEVFGDLDFAQPPYRWDG